MEFRFIESLHNKANQRNLNFCANSSRLLRKLDHVLLWILSNDTRLSLCRAKKISMTSNVLPLHFAPSQAISSQSSNVDNFLLYCEVYSLKPSQSESSLTFYLPKIEKTWICFVKLQGYLCDFKTDLTPYWHACKSQFCRRRMEFHASQK